MCAAGKVRWLCCASVSLCKTWQLCWEGCAGAELDTEGTLWLGLGLRTVPRAGRCEKSCEEDAVVFSWAV